MSEAGAEATASPDTADAPPDAAPGGPTLEALLRDPDTGEALRREGEAYVSPGGRRYPIVRGIPRFVADDKYVGSFSFEWNTHTQTQLDARTGATWSEEIFRTKTGLTPDDVRGKVVLDAGVGAGRFTDMLARWGAARVVGADLSFAVEAARDNLREHANASVVQADIGRLPFGPGTFDIIVSIGVLHHTPDTRAHFERLVPLLRPGGTICIWVYPHEGDYLKRNAWIPFTRRIPSERFYRWCRWFVPLAQRHRRNLLVQYVGQLFPFSDQGYGLENDILDTFDAYSPWFHWTHTPEEVTGWFRAVGLQDVRVMPWNTSVRGTRPLGAT